VLNSNRSSLHLVLGALIHSAIILQLNRPLWWKDIERHHSHSTLVEHHCFALLLIIILEHPSRTPEPEPEREELAFLIALAIARIFIIPSAAAAASSKMCKHSSQSQRVDVLEFNSWRLSLAISPSINDDDACVRVH
jgi:hypothetical protein